MTISKQSDKIGNELNMYKVPWSDKNEHTLTWLWNVLKYIDIKTVL